MFRIILKIIYFVSDSISGFSMWPTFRLIQFSIEYQRLVTSSSSSFCFVKRAKNNNSNFTLFMRKIEPICLNLILERYNLYWKIRSTRERNCARACVCVCMSKFEKIFFEFVMFFHFLFHILCMDNPVFRFIFSLFK